MSPPRAAVPTILGVAVSIAFIGLVARFEDELIHVRSNPEDIVRYRAELERATPMLKTLKITGASGAPTVDYQVRCEGDNSGDFRGQPRLVLRWQIAPTGQAPVLAAGRDADAGLAKLGWLRVPDEDKLTGRTPRSSR